MNQKQNNQNQSNLPVAKQEDVEFSAEIADKDDFEAAQRAQAADDRQEDQ